MLLVAYVLSTILTFFGCKLVCLYCNSNKLRNTKNKKASILFGV